MNRPAPVLTALLGLAALLALSTSAAAQPWRYVDAKGNVHYTSNPDELPPEMRERVLEKWRADVERRREEAEARKAAGGGGGGNATPSMPVVVPVEPSPKEPTAPPTDAETKAAEVKLELTTRIAELQQTLAETRTALDIARRRALEVPDGFTFAERNRIEARVRQLEAQINAAKIELSVMP